MLNPISTWSLLLQLFELAPERKNFPIATNQKYIYRLLKRNFFPFRAKTHQGQILAKNCFTQTSLFLNEIWNKIIDYPYWDALIGNIDETPIFFSTVPSKTIAKKGGKTIIIRTQKQEKCIVSVLLTITADGGKLAPYLIFKAKSGGRIENELQKDEHVLNKQCYISCNENAWATDKILADWFNKIWFPYLKKENAFNDEVDGLLILDQATSHMTTNIINILKKGFNEVTFIPPGLTRFLQPLDVSINKPFKQNLREKYISFCINNGAENIKVSRTKIISFICEAWYDSSVISKDIVYKSFRVTGIANKLDHSEDQLFKAWSQLEKEQPFINNDLEEDYNLNENNEISDDEED